MRRTGMRPTTQLLTAALLAVAACGTDTADDSAGSSNDSGADSASDPGAESVDPQSDNESEGITGNTVPADQVLLADSVSGAVAPPTVLASPTSVQSYPGWFSSEPDLYAQVRGALAAQSDYPSASRPLLAFTNGPSCTSVDDAKLMADGARVYAVFDGLKQQECFAAHTQVAIFEVDRSDLPRDFVLVGTDSSDADDADTSAGPGELLAFQELRSTPSYQPPSAREVTDGSDLDEFAAALPSGRADVRNATTNLGDDQRAFAFVLTGCTATSAELILAPSHVIAGTVGGEAVRCFRPVHYAAVFAVDSDQLPKGVEVG
jgi:hypothetical protein